MEEIYIKSEPEDIDSTNWSEVISDKNLENKPDWFEEDNVSNPSCSNSQNSFINSDSLSDSKIQFSNFSDKVSLLLSPEGSKSFPNLSITSDHSLTATSSEILNKTFIPSKKASYPTTDLNSSLGPLSICSKLPTLASNSAPCPFTEVSNPSSSPSEPSKRERKFWCQECGFRTLTAKLLKKHSEIHERGKLYPCPSCSYQTFVRRNWLLHTKGHSITKRYSCEEKNCSYCTNVKGRLLQHMLTHSEERLFKCDDCSYSTNRKEHLIEHHLKHTNEMCFACPHCSYRTNIKRNLGKHIQRHSLDRCFKCSECLYETNVKTKLLEHMVKHSTAKLFKCTKCNYKTTRKRCLTTHMDVHMDYKRFKCALCGYEAHRKSSLKSHHADKHSDMCHILNLNILPRNIEADQGCQMLSYETEDSHS